MGSDQPHNLLPLMEPLFNLREVVKQMLLLEDHLFHPRKGCSDCINKHLLTIEAFAEELSTLDSDNEYSGLGNRVAEFARKSQRRYQERVSPEILAQDIRTVRKEVSKLIMGYKISHNQFASTLGMAHRMARKFLGHKLIGATKDIRTGDRTGVGFFIPLPEEMADRMPDLSPKDNSPAHVTFLYVGEVTVEQQELFLRIATRVIQEITGPVQVMPQYVEHFTHPAKEQRVAVEVVRFSQDMAHLRWKLREALLDAGFDVQDSFPTVYRPHVTLRYFDDMESLWKGELRSGVWEFNTIEIWGLPEIHEVKF